MLAKQAHIELHSNISNLPQANISSFAKQSISIKCCVYIIIFGELATFFGQMVSSPMVWSVRFGVIWRDDVGIVPYDPLPILIVGADAHIRPAGFVAFFGNSRRIRSPYAGG